MSATGALCGDIDEGMAVISWGDADAEVRFADAHCGGVEVDGFWGGDFSGGVFFCPCPAACDKVLLAGLDVSKVRLEKNGLCVAGQNKHVNPDQSEHDYHKDHCKAVLSCLFTFHSASSPARPIKNR